MFCETCIEVNISIDSPDDDPEGAISLIWLYIVVLNCVHVDDGMMGKIEGKIFDFGFTIFITENKWIKVCGVGEE